MIRLAGSAREAEQAIARDTHCAIVNLALPDGDSLDLAARLRALQPTVRIIYLTSRGPSELPDHLKRASPLVVESPGLILLKIALAKALRSSA